MNQYNAYKLRIEGDFSDVDLFGDNTEFNKELFEILPSDTISAGYICISCGKGKGCNPDTICPSCELQFNGLTERVNSPMYPSLKKYHTQNEIKRIEGFLERISRLEGNTFDLIFLSRTDNHKGETITSLHGNYISKAIIRRIDIDEVNMDSQFMIIKADNNKRISSECLEE